MNGGQRQCALTLALLFAISLGAVGCAVKDEMMNRPGATKSQGESLSLEEQYRLMKQLYELMQVQFAEAQRVISLEPWIWVSYGINPDAGTHGPIARIGADSDSSYHLQISASTLAVEGRGDRSDLDPMLSYFAAKGWQTETKRRGSGDHWWAAEAVTNEGNLFIYTVQENGYYNLSFYSAPVSGDRRGLAEAMQERRPDDWKGPEISLPGEHVPFPDW